MAYGEEFNDCFSHSRSSENEHFTGTISVFDWSFIISNIIVHFFIFKMFKWHLGLYVLDTAVTVGRYIIHIFRSKYAVCLSVLLFMYLVDWLMD